MKTTTMITCASCGKKVEKLASEIKRQKNKGKKLFYCNLQCAGKNSSNLKHVAQFHNNFKVTKYTRQPDQYTDFRWYMKSVVKNSKKRNQSFDVDLQYLKELWESQNGICPFTKCKLTLRTHNYEQDRSPYQASLDRIDSTKGYTKGNVRFVCLMFNDAKNNFSDDDVIEFCKLVGSINQ